MHWEWRNGRREMVTKSLPPASLECFFHFHTTYNTMVQFILYKSYLLVASRANNSSGVVSLGCRQFSGLHLLGTREVNSLNFLFLYFRITILHFNIHCAWSEACTWQLWTFIRWWSLPAWSYNSRWSWKWELWGSGSAYRHPSTFPSTLTFRTYYHSRSSVELIVD